LYLGITLGIFFLAHQIEFENQVLNFVYRNSMLVLLIIFLFFNEKRTVNSIDSE
jgi:hypothetical protein